MAAGAGLRVVGAVPLDEMADRLAQTVGVDAVLVDLRSVACDAPRMTALLMTLLAWPGWTDSRPVLLVDLPAVETVAALLHIRLDRLLCNPGLSDIGTEFCVLAREKRQRAEMGFHLSDIGRETDAGRLEQLSADVRRLAQTIDRLAREDQGDGTRSLRDRAPGYAPPPAPGGPDRGAHGGPGAKVAATRQQSRAHPRARRPDEHSLHQGTHRGGGGG